MKNKLNEYLNQMKTNKLFKRTMKTYFIIAFIVFLAYAFVMVMSIYNASIKQLTDAEQKMLSQAETTNDYILRNVNAAADTVFENDLTAINAMSKPYDPVWSTDVSRLISDMRRNTAAIDKVYFFNLKNNCIYTGENPVYTRESFPDKELLELVGGTGRFTINIPHILKFEDAKGPREKNTILSLYKYSDTSCMAVFIDSNAFNGMVNANLDNKNQNMMILKSDGTVLSANDGSLFGKNLSDDRVIKQLFSEKKDIGVKSIGDRIYCYRKSDTLNSLYVCDFRSSSVVVSFFWQIIVIILFTLLLMLAYLISSIEISLSIFRPFKELRADIVNILEIEQRDVQDGLGSEKDIELIADNLAKIKAEYNAMQDREYMYSETKMNELVYNITVGAYNYDLSELDEYSIRFPYPYFTVALMRLDGSANIERSNLGLVLYGTANAGVELLTDANTVAYATTYTNEFDVIFLINHTSPVFETKKLNMIQKYASTAFPVTLSAAYDTAKGDIESIPQLFRNVNVAMQYRLTHGHGCVISYKELTAVQGVKCDYPARIEKAIIREINQKNLEKATESVDKFIEAISEMPYSYVLVHSSVLLMAIGAHTAGEKKDSLYNDLSKELFRFETIDEIRNMLVSRCNDAIISSSDIEINDKYMMISNMIEEYINTHYTDPNLSIDVIASYVNKSANYTRSIFKQNKNISISDYITKKRFDEVCRMLVETNLTAQAIAEKNGMNSGSYFYTAFKKYTGYTPEQYRKMNMKG